MGKEIMREGSVGKGMLGGLGGGGGGGGAGGSN